MYISKLRFRLLQFGIQGLNRNSELCCSVQNVLRRPVHSEVNPKITALRKKLLYCEYLDGKEARLGYLKYKKMKIKELLEQKEEEYYRLAHEPVTSVLLEDMLKEQKQDAAVENEENSDVEEKRDVPIHMPYSRIDPYETRNILPDDIDEDTSKLLNTKYKDLYEKYLEAKNAASKGGDQPDFEDYMENNDLPKGELWKVPPTWMSDFEQYDDTLLNTSSFNKYGTPDPSSKVSSIPCGGCGALLHCKDPQIPGYLPSELFVNSDNEDLKVMTCQRCHFLKYYNASLEVKVSIEDYPKLLSVIKKKKCAIILIIDLTDFPCSIWPDLKSIMHPFTPIFLVGNKVDLLPRDCPKFFNNVKAQLLNSVLETTGVKRENITHVELTSAKTGYGIEELINKLQHKWRHKGDVYLVGCTNVGKSSMFNTLINSDYCKVQAVDLVQRATISPWPGTTLNLLKFPILNPTAKKLLFRMQRLKQEQIYRHEALEYRNRQFKETGKLKYANLQDYVSRTFNDVPKDVKADVFSEVSSKALFKKVGLDESDPQYEQSRWCYDTPGTIQQDQILDLLTTDELLLTLPESIISPRTLMFRPNQTIFLAGMGRLDYVEGNNYIRCTVFASDRLPITMCYTVDADEVYNQLLETEAFVVPINNPERLKLWPQLESKEIRPLIGIHRNQLVADVVLSSIGWIGIAPHENEKAVIKAWTPQGRGIYLRTPALLSKSVALRGYKMKASPMYSMGRRVYVK